ncbi:MAG TPA: polysaccharide deacetylase family protein [bacterium]|nr:polysaccharide deacetylase family protein [bacterium]
MSETKSRNHHPILAFHKVDDRFEWGITRVTPHRFQRVIRYLSDNAYTSLPLEKLTENKIPVGPAVTLTFDDAYENIMDHAVPPMQELGFTGTVFVIAGYIGRENTWDVNLGGKRFRHLSWEQIRQLHSMGWEIGSHGCCHVDLTRLTLKELIREIRVSKCILEDGLNNKIRFISFPFGRYNQRVIDSCQEEGYICGCALIKKNHDYIHESFVLQRKAYYLFDGINSLKAKMGGRFIVPEMWKLKLINEFSSGTVWVKNGFLRKR